MLEIVPVVIVGAGDHGREIATLIGNSEPPDGGRWGLLGFLDSDPSVLGSSPAGHPDLTVLGGMSEVASLPPGTAYYIGIGSGDVRKDVASRMPAGLRPGPALVAPGAWVAPSARLSPGVVVFPQAVVSTSSVVGEHSHLNFGVVVAHDVHIEDYVTINPGATVAGNCRLGAGSTIGAGATVRDGVTIASGTFVGLGSGVIADTAYGQTVVGLPARPWDRS